MKMNSMFLRDFYKVGHIFQYPVGTQEIYSNLTARSFKLAPKGVDAAVVIGLQKFCIETLQEQFNENFFKRDKNEVMAEFNQLMQETIGGVDSKHIAELWDVGYLPIEIKALPEGSRVPAGVPLLTIRNTDPKFFWLVNSLETLLSAELWKIMTVATLAFEYKKMLREYAFATGSAVDFVYWQGHDFSMRGMPGWQDAAGSGIGHVLSFYGTDTIPAIVAAKTFYDANFVGGSVAATEHSVMCAGGEEDERETFLRLITQVQPQGIISIVSDTWDYWNVLTEILPSIKTEIMNRKPDALGNAKVVIRPDSGDPVEIICGREIIEITNAVSIEGFTDYAVDELKEKVAQETPHGERGDDHVEDVFLFKGQYFKVSCEIEWSRYDKQYYFMDGHYNVKVEPVELTAQEKGSIQVLWELFGGTISATGHKILDSHIGLIYGDSITLDRASEILRRLKDKGFASQNVVFGIGSYTYQYMTRDTLGLAMKATSCVINGQRKVMQKDPKTGSGKKSARGLLRVEMEDGKYVLYEDQTEEQEKQGALKTVFCNGVLTHKDQFDTMRTRLEAYL